MAKKKKKKKKSTVKTVSLKGLTVSDCLCTKSVNLRLRCHGNFPFETTRSQMSLASTRSIMYMFPFVYGNHPFLCEISPISTLLPRQAEL